jgi:hypothetical protein
MGVSCFKKCFVTAKINCTHIHSTVTVNIFHCHLSLVKMTQDAMRYIPFPEIQGVRSISLSQLTHYLDMGHSCFSDAL